MQQSGAWSREPESTAKEGGSQRDVERVQKRIAYWDKQNHAVPAPNCMLKVRGEIIKDKGL